jgi:hypothetical protein
MGPRSAENDLLSILRRDAPHGEPRQVADNHQAASFLSRLTAAAMVGAAASGNRE